MCLMKASLMSLGVQTGCEERAVDYRCQGYEHCCWEGGFADEGAVWVAWELVYRGAGVEAEACWQIEVYS